MEITVDGMKIFYERYEGEGEPVVIMHGWGADSEVMKSLFDAVKRQGRSAISLDLPFFGNSAPPHGDFTVYDYAQTVTNLLEALNCRTVTLLGHSFGGRLAVIIGASEKTDDDTAFKKKAVRAGKQKIINHSLKISKIILIDAAGCRPRFSLKKKLKIYLYKLKKLLKMPQKNYGSFDYQRLPPFMKGVFVRVVNAHLEHCMKKISAPTLLIWGQDDADTPLYMARRMNKLIKPSGLVTLENAGHFSFLDRPQETEAIISSFIKS